MRHLKELHDFEKPREKLADKGAAALKNEELMAVLLGSGVRGKDVRKLAKEIVELMDRDFERLDLDRLLGVHGLGKAKASQVLAAVELSRRYLVRTQKRVTSAAEVYEELHAYRHRQQEYFLTITLDGASHIIEIRTVFIGTLNQSLVHPREVFADAIADRAASIIIAHNHPSGTLEPSAADRSITRRLKEVAALVGIELIDHVILTKNGYFSFADEGMI